MPDDAPRPDLDEAERLVRWAFGSLGIVADVLAEYDRRGNALAEVRAAVEEHPDIPHGELLGELRRLVENDDYCTTLAVQHADRGELITEVARAAGHEADFPGAGLVEHVAGLRAALAERDAEVARLRKIEAALIDKLLTSEDREMAAIRALDELVHLKDGPRDDRYWARKGEAWEQARRALAAAPSPAEDEDDLCPEWCDGYRCTEPAGHRGDHIARGLAGSSLRRWAASVPDEDECQCTPCTDPGYGVPGPSHGAACCYGTGIAEYSHDCPNAEHRDLARRQFPVPAVAEDEDR